VRHLKKIIIFLFCTILISACTAQHHRNQVEDKNNKLTLGNVQKNVKVGMSGAEIARVMGSPNVVTKDGDNSEVWIYDKISTVAAGSNSSLFGIGGAAGGSRNVGGIGLGTYSSGASSQNQKTLTVIIKFVDGKVSKVDYNASSF